MFRQPDVADAFSEARLRRNQILLFFLYFFPRFSPASIRLCAGVLRAHGMMEGVLRGYTLELLCAVDGGRQLRTQMTCITRDIN